MSGSRYTWLVVAMAGMVACGARPIDAVGVPPSDLSSGLLAHWSFDRSSGTVVTDESGRGYDGQLTGGTSIADGRFGGALRLAAGESMAVPNFPAATPSWTVAAWLRVSAAQLAADAEMWTTIMTTEDVSAGGWQLNLERYAAEPRVGFGYWGPAPVGTTLVKCMCVRTDVWLHFVGIVDVNRRVVSLFHDGALVDQLPWRTAIIPGDSTLYLGRWNKPGRTLNGDLDDVAVWTRALTPPEVASLYLRSPGP